MHKLDKYIRRYTQKYVESSRSNYYQFGHQILRVSDHIGTGSSGTYSIIILPNIYLLHMHKSGNIRSISYKEALMFIKSLYLCSSLISIADPIIAFEPSPTDQLSSALHGTELQHEILKCFLKLGNTSRRTFKKKFNLTNIILKQFETWYEVEFDLKKLQQFFKERYIIFNYRK